ncbi:uncharacterized protein LOC116253082 isoform X2 [Nymphaea colorata]|uniref:uncharacterized protein LOC116253082 isoform X2 n=1 Tax=Nymphaea colorata TaxID=210225 RepID=UPI00129E1120|nr:uncharacterized protein LOC116253082 isoform X2 [Nymphaea colorata]
MLCDRRISKQIPPSAAPPPSQKLLTVAPEAALTIAAPLPHPPRPRSPLLRWFANATVAALKQHKHGGTFRKEGTCTKNNSARAIEWLVFYGQTRETVACGLHRQSGGNAGSASKCCQSCQLQRCCSVMLIL